MMDKIKSLVKELASLSQPYNLESLALIFYNYKELFDNNVSPPEQLAPIWYSLRNVREQIVDWQHLDSEQKAVAAVNSIIIKSDRQLDEIEKQIHKLKDEVLQQQGQINKCYPNLLEAYHACLMKQEPTIALGIPSDLRQQRYALDSYLEILQEQLKILELDSTRLSLSESLIKRKELIAQLKMLNIIISENVSDATRIYDKLKIQREDLGILRLGLETVQRELADTISILDVQQEIENKTLLIDETNAELLSVTTKLKQSLLAPETRKTLENDYQLATDKQKLLEERQNALNWHNSSLNPYAWYEWRMNPAFKTDRQQLQAEFHYLQLWHQQAQLTSESIHLNQQLASAQGFVKPQLTTFKVSSDSCKLHERALQLLKEHNPMYASTNINNVALMTDILDSLDSIHKKNEVLEEALQILPTLIELDRTILELRTTHLLIVEIDNLILSPEELNKLRSSELTRQKDIQEQTEKINSCKTCIQSMDRLADLNKLAKELNESKRIIKAELKHNKAKQVNMPDCSSHDMKKNQTQHCISRQIATLETDLQEILTRQEESLSYTQEKNTKFKALITYQDSLNAWNRRIRNISPAMTVEFEEWYQELFVALQVHMQNETQHNQACQLLRDIYFEIAHPQANDAVLSHYRALCPNPKSSWELLTSLKPAFATEPHSLAEVKNPTLNNRLKALYQQQKLLAKNYPREAELLHQAICNLHQGCLMAEENPTHPVLKNLNFSLNDPRYEALHNHRGFFKICEWLAQLCLALLTIIHANQGKNYRQLFFFKPTHTSKLLNETTTELIHCLAG
ncbi:hypothetical protein [Legionella cardiaca]|uniref:Effector protein A, substrate of the Dot/Icm secretion system n=1 Tax=Legionella cardiaca TaxID=1071983 RepID=A0ABY8AR24_9GAMM|nr:hypothetical protein [Legionella cardiaca]WED43144.1 hypothetical protein PXX05_14795 [Legionella cardiaca]